MQVGSTPRFMFYSSVSKDKGSRLTFPVTGSKASGQAMNGYQEDIAWPSLLTPAWKALLIKSYYCQPPKTYMRWSSDKMKEVENGELNAQKHFEVRYNANSLPLSHLAVKQLAELPSNFGTETPHFERLILWTNRNIKDLDLVLFTECKLAHI